MFTLKKKSYSIFLHFYSSSSLNYPLITFLDSRQTNNKKNNEMNRKTI